MFPRVICLSLVMVPVKVTLFGNRVSADAIKLRIVDEIILILRWALVL